MNNIKNKTKELDKENFETLETLRKKLFETLEQLELKREQLLDIKGKITQHITKKLTSKKEQLETSIISLKEERDILREQILNIQTLEKQKQVEKEQHQQLQRENHEIEQKRKFLVQKQVKKEQLQTDITVLLKKKANIDFFLKWTPAVSLLSFFAASSLVIKWTYDIYNQIQDENCISYTNIDNLIEKYGKDSWTSQLVNILEFGETEQYKLEKICFPKKDQKLWRNDFPLGIITGISSWFFLGKTRENLIQEKSKIEAEISVKKKLLVKFNSEIKKLSKEQTKKPILFDNVEMEVLETSEKLYQENNEELDYHDALENEISQLNEGTLVQEN